MADLKAVILAGGDGSRMRGEDKPFALLDGQPMLEHVLHRLRPEISDIVISVNRDAERFAEYGLPCIKDTGFPQKSPLLGIYSAMEYFASVGDNEGFLLCVPVDVPVFPTQVIQDLLSLAEQTGSGVSYTITGDQPQPLFAVWSMQTLPLLKQQLQEGAWGVLATLKVLEAGELHYELDEEGEFANINSPEDLQHLQDQLSEQ